MSRITQQELESYLWGAAVLLRGLIDAGDYKQFIFPLLFYKRVMCGTKSTKQLWPIQTGICLTRSSPRTIDFKFQRARTGTMYGRRPRT
jgi:hypothetical protein